MLLLAIDTKLGFELLYHINCSAIDCDKSFVILDFCRKLAILEFVDLHGNPFDGYMEIR